MVLAVDGGALKTEEAELLHFPPPVLELALVPVITVSMLSVAWEINCNVWLLKFGDWELRFVPGLWLPCAPCFWERWSIFVSNDCNVSSI
jgi:hypothetical protein